MHVSHSQESSDFKWVGRVSIQDADNSAHIQLDGRWANDDSSFAEGLGEKQTESFHQFVYQALGSPEARDFDNKEDLQTYLTTKAENFSRSEVGDTDLTRTAFFPPKLLENKDFWVELNGSRTVSLSQRAKPTEQGSLREIPKPTLQTSSLHIH